MRPSARAEHGVTLVELIVSLAIAGVLVGMAIPAMHGLAQRHYARSALASLAQAARNARMLSIQRQRRALLCPSLDGRHCSNQGDWSKGWLVSLDSNHDGQPDEVPGMTGLPQRDVRILASRGRSRIYYHPDGSAPGSNVTLRVCPSRDVPAKVGAVVVSNAGRVRVTRVDASPCPRGP